MHSLIRAFAGLHNPVRHPSLAIWLDATDRSSLTLSANRVSAWNDKGGKGNHVVQATGSLQPLYVASAINGKPAIHFYDDATAKLLSRADNATLDHANFTMFLVTQRVQILGTPERIAGKFSTTTPANQRELSCLYVNSNNFQCATSSSGTVADGIGSVTSNSNVGSPEILDFSVSTPYGNSDAARARRNNDAATQAIGSVPGIFAGTSPFHVGAIDGGGQPYAGYIGELLFYTSKLPESQRMKILRYLANKWRVTISY